MVSHKVSILGAGNAGFTIAFHLAHLGHEVILYEHPNFGQVLEPLHQHGEVVKALAEEGEFKAVLSGEAKLKGSTTDIKEAIDFAEIIIVIVPAFGQLALPHARDGQIFLMQPGNFASLAFAKYMNEKGVKKDLVFAETESIPYACRRVRENEVFISGMKQTLTCGVFPGKKTDETLAKLRPLFTLELKRGDMVLVPGFMNLNMTLHPPPTIFNTGWMESRGGDFSFYREGASKSVCNYIDAIDKERLAVAKALGFQILSTHEQLGSWYAGLEKFSTTFECVSQSPYYAYFRAPNTLENRYISEDTAYLLVPISQYLAPKLGVATPAIGHLLAVAEILLQRKIEPARDFTAVMKEGESLDQMKKRLFEGITEGPI